MRGLRKKGSQRLITEKESSAAEAAMFNDHSLQKVPFMHGFLGNSWSMHVSTFKVG